jgi:hypothetical protein
MPWNLSKTYKPAFPAQWGVEGMVISPCGVSVALEGAAYKFIDCGDIGIAVYMRTGKNAVAYRADGSIAWAVGTGLNGAGEETGGFTGAIYDGKDTVRLFHACFTDSFRVSDGVWLDVEQSK